MKKEIGLSSLSSQLLELGVTLSKHSLANVRRINSKPILDFKIGFKQIQVSSSQEVMDLGGLDGVTVSWSKKNKKILYAPISNTKSIKVTLYYEGVDKIIPNGIGIYSYFSDRGLGPIEKDPGSILVNTMSLLPEDVLDGLGIPEDTNIILLSKNVYVDKYMELSFPAIFRTEKGRILTMMSINEKFDGRFAFILMDKLV